MLLSLPYLANWKATGHGLSMVQMLKKSSKVLVVNEGVDGKARDKHAGHFPILKVLTNDTIWIKHGHIMH